MDISIVIDTSGSQIGNKQEVIQNFVNSLMAEFDTQTVVKVAITAIGDGRIGQVETVFGPVQHANAATLQAAINSIEWLVYSGTGVGTFGLAFLAGLKLDEFCENFQVKIFGLILSKNFQAKNL